MEAQINVELTDAKAKIERQEKINATLQREIECHEAKIVSLLNDVDAATRNAAEWQKRTEESLAEPSQWETDRVRLIEAQTKERSEMIDLLSRERAQAGDSRCLGGLQDQRTSRRFRRSSIRQIADAAVLFIV